ncbi:MAG: hypothetical protein ACTS8S_17585, partial [Giesbergeria sp.]
MEFFPGGDSDRVGQRFIVMSATSVSAVLDRCAPRLTALLGELVRCDTTNPPGRNYDAMTRLLVAKLEEAGLSARRLTPPRAAQRAALPPEQWDHHRYNV